MTSVRLWALAVFVLDELEAAVRRACHRIASAILLPVAWVMMRRPGWLT